MKREEVLKRLKLFLNDDALKTTEPTELKKKYPFIQAFLKHFVDAYNNKEIEEIIVNATPPTVETDKRHNGFWYILNRKSYEETAKSYLEKQKQAREKYQKDNKIERKTYSLFD